MNNKLEYEGYLAVAITLLPTGIEIIHLGFEKGDIHEALLGTLMAGLGLLAIYLRSKMKEEIIDSIRGEINGQRN